MKAIILAAGRGSRMRNLTDERPKCLVELRGKALLDWQLEALHAAGIKDIAIVTGYKHELLAGRGLVEFHNPRWAQTQMVSSLACAEEWLRVEPCIVSYSDIFYNPSAVQSLIACPAALAVAYDTNWQELWAQRFGDPLLDAETFRLTPEGMLTEIGNKPKSVEEVQGQYMGLLRFTPEGWAEVVRIRSSLPPEQCDRMHMTGTLQKVIEAGRMAIAAMPYGGEWGEVDSAEDLKGYLMEPVIWDESKIRALFNLVLDVPASGRSLTLQALIRYFLGLFDPPRILEALHSPEAMADDEVWPNQARATNALLSQLHRSSELLQADLENLLEDCVVFLFGMICCNEKKTVLIQDVRHIYNFCGADIVQQLRYNGFNAWSVLTNSTEVSEQRLPIDKPLLEKMDYVSLILCSVWGLRLDRNYRTRTFCLSNTPSKYLPEWCIFDNDFFSVPNHSDTDTLLKKYRDACPLPPDLLGHRRKSTAIPVGNVKMLRMRELRRKIRPEERNRILFLSEALDYPNSIVKEYGITFIRRILDRFPNNTLVYRPHPKWANHPVTLKIRDTLAGEARFVFDSNSLSEDTIASGCVLLTDGSISGLTYCLASSRPSIYINPQVAHFNADTLNIKFEDGPLFRFCSTIEEALDAMEDLVSDPFKEFDKIAEQANNAFAHPHDGQEYLISSIRAIVENKTLPDWKSLEIPEEGVGDESAASYVGLIRNEAITFSGWPRYIDTDINNFPPDVKAILLYTCNYEHEWHFEFWFDFLDWILRNIKKYGFCQFKGVIASSIMRMIFERGGAKNITAVIASLHKITEEIMQAPQRKANETHSLLSWFSPYLSDEAKQNGNLCEIARKQVEFVAGQENLVGQEYWKSLMHQLKEESGLDKVAFYGAGRYCQRLLEAVLPLRLWPGMILDQNPGKDFPVPITAYHKDTLDKFDNLKTIIITSNAHNSEIQNQLLCEHGANYKIINPFDLTQIPLTQWLFSSQTTN